jgi:serine/threonine protein kinase/WD40 repeat protein
MNCPDDAELAGFLNEALPRGTGARVADHIDTCARCQGRLDALLANQEVPTPELPDAPSGVLALGPDTATDVVNRRPVAAFVGLPDVPGFDVLAEIGRGGMGVVFKARHRRLNRLVALKMILAGAVADPSDVQRFLFEAVVLGRVSHPQIVQVFAADTYTGPNGVPIPYLAMELLEGGSLSRKLRDQNDSSGAPRWPAPRSAAALVEGLARAVHAAHLRGVVHRDLKPGNVLFAGATAAPAAAPRGSGREPAPPESVAKVMDFGLAKFTAGAGTGADITQSGQVVGTPQYMAPEQATGAREIGPAADVYSLGAILFECLSGRPPFVGSDPVSVLLQVVNERPPDVRALRPDVPRDLAAVTMKCLEKDPARRYASAEALAADLRRFLDNRPTRARPVTATERALFWARRNPAVAGLCAALALVLVAGFVAVAALWVRAENRAEDADFAARRAERSEQHARTEAGRAEAALRDALKQRALLEFRRGAVSCDEGRVTEGLGMFALAVELAEQSGQTDLARVARVNLAAWLREFPPTPVPLPHAQQPRHVAFVPGGTHLVAAGHKGELVLWDLATKARAREYKPAPRGPLVREFTYWTVAISPNGRTLAAGSSDGVLTLWDRDAREPLAALAATAGARDLWSVAFTDDDTLWTNDGRNGLRKWNVSDRNKPRPTAAPAPVVRDSADVHVVVAGPDGTKLYTGDRDATVREWDAATGKAVREWKLMGWITDVAVSPDGARLAVTGPLGAWVFDLTTGQGLFDLGLAGTYGNGIAFAPKRPYLVTTDGDGNVRFWHRDTGQPVGIPMRLAGDVTRPRFRPDSDQFAVPAGGAVFLSGLPDPPGDLFVRGSGSRVRGLAFAPDGARLAVADEFGLTVAEAHTGKALVSYPRLPLAPLSVALDPGGALVGTREGFTRIDLGGRADPVPDPASRLLRRVRHAEYAGGALFLMTDHGVGRYDPVALKPEAFVFAAPDAPAGVQLDALAVHPDGTEVLVAFADTVRFLNPSTLRPVREWRGGGGVLAARYTPDGTKVVLARRDNYAEVLRAADGARATPRALTHERAVTCAAVSPNGRLVLTGSRDRTARFWDAATGLPLGAPLRHAGAVTCAAFHPNGAHAVTGCQHGHVSQWDLPPPPAPGTAAQLRAQHARGGDER